MNAIRLRSALALPLLLMLIAAGPAAAAGASVKVKPADWAQIRSGQDVARLPGITALIAKFRERKGDKLVIRYTDLNAGRSRAEKLRAWLVALGVPASNIQLDPGTGDKDLMIVILQKQGARNVE